MGKIKLEVGKTYELNNGEQHVCKVGKGGTFDMGVYWYSESGVCGTFRASDALSVSHEVKPEPKTFGELTKGERGELLEHHWSGGSTQVMLRNIGGGTSWLNCPKHLSCDPDDIYGFNRGRVYRKSPTRVSGTVEINEQGEPMFDTWEIGK